MFCEITQAVNRYSIFSDNHKPFDHAYSPFQGRRKFQSRFQSRGKAHLTYHKNTTHSHQSQHTSEHRDQSCPGHYGQPLCWSGNHKTPVSRRSVVHTDVHHWCSPDHRICPKRQGSSQMHSRICQRHGGWNSCSHQWAENECTNVSMFNLKMRDTYV